MSTSQVSSSRTGRSTNWSFYLWVGLALAVAVTAVILGWHSGNGTTDPSDKANALHMSRTTAVINSGVLVFREGLETILVLAAITASFRGSNSGYRRPIAAGAALAIAASIGTWFIAVGVLGIFSNTGLTLQAITGIPAILVLLLVMNWFFHKVYWTGWISHHNKRRRSLMSSEDPDKNRRRLLLGFALLGFSSVYREGFEIVLFLQNLRLTFGSSIVLEGVLLGALFTTATGVLTFALHAKLPYKRLLIITGVMLLVVLLVMVGEEINEMQLAGWIGTSSMGFTLPGWLGEWFSIFANWQTVIAQFLAILIVVGSYVGAQYFKVWRPRRRGLATARMADAPPAPTINSRPLSV